MKTWNAFTLTVIVAGALSFAGCSKKAAQATPPTPPPPLAAPTATLAASPDVWKERPFCTEDNEQCWAENRVDHITLAQ